MVERADIERRVAVEPLEEKSLEGPTRAALIATLQSRINTRIAELDKKGVPGVQFARRQTILGLIDQLEALGGDGKQYRDKLVVSADEG